MSYDVVTVGVDGAHVMVKPVDGLPARGTLGLGAPIGMHLGGLAGLTAAVVCQLGGAAAFVGSLGEDGFGDYLSATLAKAGVDTRGTCWRGDACSVPRRWCASPVMASGPSCTTWAPTPR